MNATGPTTAGAMESPGPTATGAINATGPTTAGAMNGPGPTAARLHPRREEPRPQVGVGERLRAEVGDQRREGGRERGEVRLEPAAGRLGGHVAQAALRGAQRDGRALARAEPGEAIAQQDRRAQLVDLPQARDHARHAGRQQHAGEPEVLAAQLGARLPALAGAERDRAAARQRELRRRGGQRERLAASEAEVAGRRALRAEVAMAGEEHVGVRRRLDRGQRRGGLGIGQHRRRAPGQRAQRPGEQGRPRGVVQDRDAGVGAVPRRREVEQVGQQPERGHGGHRGAVIDEHAASRQRERVERHRVERQPRHDGQRAARGALAQQLERGREQHLAGAQQPVERRARGRAGVDHVGGLGQRPLVHRVRLSQRGLDGAEDALLQRARREVEQERAARRRRPDVEAQHEPVEAEVREQPLDDVVARAPAEHVHAAARLHVQAARAVLAGQPFEVLVEGLGDGGEMAVEDLPGAQELRARARPGQRGRRAHLAQRLDQALRLARRHLRQRVRGAAARLRDLQRVVGERAHQLALDRGAHRRAATGQHRVEDPAAGPVGLERGVQPRLRAAGVLARPQRTHVAQLPRRERVPVAQHLQRLLVRERLLQRPRGALEIAERAQLVGLVAQQVPDLGLQAQLARVRQAGAQLRLGHRAVGPALLERGEPARDEPVVRVAPTFGLRGDPAEPLRTLLGLRGGHRHVGIGAQQLRAQPRVVQVRAERARLLVVERTAPAREVVVVHAQARDDARADAGQCRRARLARGGLDLTQRVERDLERGQRHVLGDRGLGVGEQQRGADVGDRAAALGQLLEDEREAVARRPVPAHPLLELGGEPPRVLVVAHRALHHGHARGDGPLELNPVELLLDQGAYELGQRLALVGREAGERRERLHAHAAPRT